MKKIYLLLLCMVFSTPILFAQIYVTEAGAGAKNGTSWANAYDNTQLQQAINEAETAPVKQVWVAKGTYKPTELLSTDIYTARTAGDPSTSSGRDAAFILKTGVEIYGGFAGGENSINDRVFPDIFSDFKDPAVPYAANPNETILSGDLNNSNAADDGDAYHVVAARDEADGAVLDGFTIQHGYGDSSDYAEIIGGDRIRRNIGAAIAFFSGKTLTFRNLLIKDNQTTNAGAAIYSIAQHDDARFNFINVRFENNAVLTLDVGTGGAVYSLADVGASELNMTSCVFVGNEGGGTSGGGAMYFGGAAGIGILNIIDSHFENNTTRDSYGGAMRINSGVANLTKTTFKDNQVTGTSSTRGGAIYSTGGSTVNADNCTFDGNYCGAVAGHWYVFSGTVNITNKTKFKGGSGTGGGGVYVNTGDVHIDDADFEENDARTGAGGAAFNVAGNLTITNSRFNKNTATAGNGGAVYITSGTSTTSNTKIINSRFYENDAASSGGAVYITSATGTDSNTEIINSIFYKNKANIATTANGVGGGAIYQTGSAATVSILKVTNSTFYKNETVNSSPAYSFFGGPRVVVAIANSIFYDNDGGDVRRSATTGTAIQEYTNNIFQTADMTTGGVRTVTNPYVFAGLPADLFANSDTPANDDFLSLSANSAALDIGENSALYDTSVPSALLITKDIADNSRIRNEVVDLGAFELQVGGDILPVTVSSFTAKLANNRTQLKWNVGTEANVAHYEIERSQNGTDFVKVAEVAANGSTSYSTVDISPALGVNYYRLSSVDNDGTRQAYSQLQTVTVASLAAEGVSVYPNPAKGHTVNVSLGNAAAGTYGYKVVSTTGSVSQQGTLSYNGSSAVISVGSLPAGVYVLHFSNGAQAKLIKQ